MREAAMFVLSGVVLWVGATLPLRLPEEERVFDA